MKLKPIETAPKDGRVLLGYTSRVDMLGNYFVIMRWNDRDQEWNDILMCAYAFRPTHWCELPTLEEIDEI